MASPKGMVGGVSLKFAETALVAEICSSLVNVVADTLLGLRILLFAANVTVLVFGRYAMLDCLAVRVDFLAYLASWMWSARSFGEVPATRRARLFFRPLMAVESVAVVE